jgi:hypothetical protein
MDTTTRYILGFSLVFVVQTLLGTTLFYLIRNWHRREPKWSWLKTLGGYLLLSLLVTLIGLIPFIGRFAAVIASLVGVKRITGLDVLATFIFSFVTGIMVLILVGIIGAWLHVDLMGWGK